MPNTDADIENFDKKVNKKPVKRNVAPSAASVFEDVLDFLADLEADVFDEPDEFIQLLDDLEHLDKIMLNESLHFAKKSTTTARITARKWYKNNRGRVKKLADRLKKSKGLQTKKSVLAKSSRTLTKKKKKKYPGTKSHVNEAINRNIEKGAKKIVEKWFEPTPYRVIKSFTIDGNVGAKLNEKIEHVCGGTWILTKRNGNRYRLSVTDNKFITPFIKHEKDITLEDFI